MFPIDASTLIEDGHLHNPQCESCQKWAYGIVAGVMADLVGRIGWDAVSDICELWGIESEDIEYLRNASNDIPGDAELHDQTPA